MKTIGTVKVKVSGENGSLCVLPIFQNNLNATTYTQRIVDEILNVNNFAVFPEIGANSIPFDYGKIGDTTLKKLDGKAIHLDLSYTDAGQIGIAYDVVLTFFCVKQDNTVERIDERIEVNKFSQISTKNISLPNDTKLLQQIEAGIQTKNTSLEIFKTYFGVGTAGQNSAPFIQGLESRITGKMQGVYNLLPTALLPKCYIALPESYDDPDIVIGRNVVSASMTLVTGVLDANTNTTSNYKLYEVSNNYSSPVTLILQ